MGINFVKAWDDLIIAYSLENFVKHKNLLPVYAFLPTKIAWSTVYSTLGSAFLSGLVSFAS